MDVQCDKAEVPSKPIMAWPGIEKYILPHLHFHIYLWLGQREFLRKMLSKLLSLFRRNVKNNLRLRHFVRTARGKNCPLLLFP